MTVAILLKLTCCSDTNRFTPGKQSATMSLHVVKEIDSVRKFFMTRKGDSDPAALQHSFADSIIHKIGLMKGLGAMDASHINEALSDDPIGPQTDRVRAHVEAVMAKHVNQSMASGHGKANKPSSKSSQFLKYWNRMCTKSEIDFLSDASKSFNSKCTLMVERAMKIGCHSADEQAKKWMLALIVRLHYAQLPSAQALYDKLQDLKRVFVTEYKILHCSELLQEYPEHANKLPASIFQAAYADEPPHPVEISSLPAIADVIPLRSNSKLLKKGSKSAPARLTAEQAFDEVTKTDDHGNVAEAGAAKPEVEQEHIKREPVVKEELQDASSDDEDVLMLKLKLAKVRAKRERLSSPSPSPKSARGSASSVSVSRSADGGFHLSSKPKLESDSPTQHDVKPEAEAHDVKPKADDYGGKMPAGETLPASDAGDETPTLADLDPYTQAAIASLKARKI